MATFNDKPGDTKPTTAKAQEQVGEMASKAKEQVGKQAKTTLSATKEQAASELSTVAQALRQTTSQLGGQDQNTIANYGNQLASQVDRLSSYLEDRNVDQMVTDAENMARRQPELFLGGAFTLGLVLARFLKSSQQSRELMMRDSGAAYTRTGPYDQGDERMPYPYGTTPTASTPERRTYGTGTS